MMLNPMWKTANNNFKSFQVECFSEHRHKKKESHRAIHWFILDSVQMPSTLDAKKISNTHRNDGKKTFQNGNVVGERGVAGKRERKMFFLGQWVWFIFRGEFVSGMTIPLRLSDGWKLRVERNRSKSKDKETFWKIDSIFLSIFSLHFQFLIVPWCDFCLFLFIWWWKWCWEWRIRRIVGEVSQWIQDFKVLRFHFHPLLCAFHKTWHITHQWTFHVCLDYGEIKIFTLADGRNRIKSWLWMKFRECWQFCIRNFMLMFN